MISRDTKEVDEDVTIMDMKDSRYAPEPTFLDCTALLTEVKKGNNRESKRAFPSMFDLKMSRDMLSSIKEIVRACAVGAYCEHIAE